MTARLTAKGNVKMTQNDYLGMIHKQEDTDEALRFSQKANAALTDEIDELTQHIAKLKNQIKDLEERRELAEDENFSLKRDNEYLEDLIDYLYEEKQ